jgi:hypothetical protein
LLGGVRQAAVSGVGPSQFMGAPMTKAGAAVARWSESEESCMHHAGRTP